MMMNCNTNVTAPGVSISKNILQSLTFGVIQQVKKGTENSKVEGGKDNALTQT